MARRRRERPEAFRDCSDEGSPVGEVEEEAEESATSVTPASDELSDALWESGAEVEESRA